MTIITVAGPIALELQQRLASELAVLGHDCEAFDAEGLEGVDPDRLARTRILCSAGFRCDAELLAAAPALRAIVTPFLGIDTIDLGAATEAGVLVARGGAPEHFVSMAESTIMLTLAACYDLPRSLAGMDPWGSQGGPGHRHMLGGRTVGVLGYGSIARALIQRLSCWDLDLIIHNRTRPAEMPTGTRFVGFDELFRSSDIVLILIGLAPETHHLIDGRVLATMKEDAILVNTARGAIIDEAALIEWLRANPARRAVIDVFEVEPLPEDSALRTLPNALLTPHCVGLNRDSASGIFRFTLENVLMATRGEIPPSICNPEVVEQWLSVLPAS
jgi:phosphoglycerate dehydrogenase-like enzyme